MRNIFSRTPSTEPDKVSSETAHPRELLSTAKKPARDGISAPGGIPSSAQDHDLQPSPLASKDDPSSKMSGFALSLGSFGDISTLLQLGFAVRRAFLEAQGGSDDIKSTIEGIDTFVLALQSVRDHLERADSVPVSVQNGIEHALGVCTQALQRVQNRVDKTKRSYEKAHGSRGWRTYWAMCLWTVLGGKAEVAGLMQQLTDQVLVLQTFVGLLNCTSLDTIESEQDKQEAHISEILTVVTSLSSRVPMDIPFTFFDNKGHAVKPMLKMTWANFVDFWEEHDFPTKIGDIAHNELYQAEFTVVRPKGSVWFELYIYDDPQAFQTPTALISPIYFYEKEDDHAVLSKEVARMFATSTGRLENALEGPASEAAPDEGSRPQFICLEREGEVSTVADGTPRTRQYFLETASGVELVEGRISHVFKQLKSKGQPLRRRPPIYPEVQDPTATSSAESRIEEVTVEQTPAAIEDVVHPHADVAQEEGLKTETV